MALNAASEASNILLNSDGLVSVSLKESFRDVVTKYDYKIQDIILNKLNGSHYPVLSEELLRDYDSEILNSETYWIVDPIDGTVNFAHNIPLYAVSIGLFHKMDFPVGVVSIPAQRELYFISPENTAYRNGEKIICDYEIDFCHGLISASFSSLKNSMLRANEYSLFGELNDSCRGCLRLGSAAVSICFVATKRLNAAYGLGVKIWDIAGAIAIAKAAQYEVWFNIKEDKISADFIVGSPNMVRGILGLLKKYNFLSKDA